MWTDLIVAPRYIEEVSSAPRDFGYSRRLGLLPTTGQGYRLPGPMAAYVRPTTLHSTGPDTDDIGFPDAAQPLAPIRVTRSR